MESFTDYYAILGVPHDASTEEIKLAFRVGALKFHPDHNKSSEAPSRFIELQKAYDILNDPEDRKTYDILYNLHLQEAAMPPSSRHRMEVASNVSQKPKSDPIYIIKSFKGGRSARFVLGNTPYSLTADQVKVLVHDGMIRLQSSGKNEYLFMYCMHCHALFFSERNRDKMGLLYFPHDLFPLCPHCHAQDWCSADSIREKRRRKAEEGREREAQKRLKIWREQHLRKTEAEVKAVRKEATWKKEERRKKAMQRKVWEKIMQCCAFGIACVLILALLGAILFSALAKPPATINLHMVNSGFVADGTVKVSFIYQPGNIPGYIEARFFNEGAVFDTQKLDTANMIADSQTISSSAFSDAPTRDGTISLFWCPYYNCMLAQPMGSLEFTVRKT